MAKQFTINKIEVTPSPAVDGKYTFTVNYTDDLGVGIPLVAVIEETTWAELQGLLEDRLPLGVGDFGDLYTRP